MTNQTRRSISATVLFVALVSIPLGRRAGAQQNAGTTTAIVGATVIDGTGAAPIPNATVVIKDKRITALGPRDKVTVPAGATVIDGAGRFVTPGFIDTNVHISMYANLETLARYLPRATEVVTEGAQLDSNTGSRPCETVTESWGR